MIPKIGFSLQKEYNAPIMQILSLLEKNGFSFVSPIWTNSEDLSHISACGKQHSLIIQSLHAPHRGIPHLWKPDSEESFCIQESFLKCIDACAQFEIPTLVIHSWQGLEYVFPKAPLDFTFFDKLIAYAGSSGINVAFENLEGEEYLAALMERYRNEKAVGFCWDSGHDHCYPHKTDFLASYGDRLIMTHLNDNFGLRSRDGTPSGDDDLHFLPYDGTIDWDSALSKLKSARKQDTLNFEFKTVSHSKNIADLIYSKLTAEEFIKKAGERAHLIAEKYSALL